MPSPCAYPHVKHISVFADLQNSKEIDGVAFEVDCSMVTIKAGADVDIGACRHLQHTCNI